MSAKTGRSTSAVNTLRGEARLEARPFSPAVRFLGFTLTELLVTLAILGVLGVMAVPTVQTVIQRRQEQDLKRSLLEVRRALDLYKQAVDDGRVTKTIGATGYPSSLEVLVEGAVDQRDPQGRKIFFLRRIPIDPLRPSDTPLSEMWGKRSYASEAADPQEGADVYDIYSLAPGTGLNGVPYRLW